MKPQIRVYILPSLPYNIVQWEYSEFLRHCKIPNKILISIVIKTLYLAIKQPQLTYNKGFNKKLNFN